MHWENRNTFCLFERYISPSLLQGVSNKGITVVPVEGLEGSKVQIIRLGSDDELKKFKKLIKATKYKKYETNRKT